MTGNTEITGRAPPDDRRVGNFRIADNPENY
jgi:hypothetical protein